jgi:predicted PurR-regulated permease PerM
MRTIGRVSYGLIAGVLVLAGVLHMGTLLLSVLFSVFALRKLDFGGRKWLALSLFALLVGAVAYGFAYFVKEAVQALPRIAETSIPLIIDFAERHHVELPFYDLASLKTLLLAGVKDQIHHVGNFARVASKEIALLIIGVVVAISLFLTPGFERGRAPAALAHNLYSRFCDELAARFASFFQSFAVVIGAQLAISAINTALTTIFLTWARLPHIALIMVLTFLCGLLPIVGNLVSNTVIVIIAFTVSPEMALIALLFLVGVHKLEYLLNSKIIGDRIKNPVWLTLLGLVLGERLMGVPGMILAPVVLYFLKVEASQFRISHPAGKPQPVEEEVLRIEN